MYKKFTFKAWLRVFKNFENMTHYKKFIKNNPLCDKFYVMQYEQYLLKEEL